MSEDETVTDEAPTVNVVNNVVEHKTKVVDSSIAETSNKKLLKKGELLRIHCNLCKKDQYFGRLDRQGNIKPEAECSHHTFLGVEKFGTN